MAGKRLVDATAFLNASSSIAKQHFSLRREQWEVLKKTSSVAKAVKAQTDRVTVTARAAAELAKRFSGPETGAGSFYGAPSKDAEAQEWKTSWQRDDATVSAGDVTAQTQPEATILTENVFPTEPQFVHEPFLDEIEATPGLSHRIVKPSHRSPYAGRQKLPPQPLPEMVEAEEKWRREAQARDDITLEKSGVAKEGNISKTAVQMTPPSRDYELRESSVPSSRFGRFWQYSSLATSMTFGAVGEGLRRAVGGQGSGALMFSESNVNRLVAGLSRMRGAALKLGQMISIQDSKALPPQIHTILQRVQDSADYMPAYQRDRVLVQNLGADWRSLFSNFEEKPFAAASIGQVHRATLASNGKEVAVKVQYPGVRDSIDSDLNNISLLLTASKALPKGLFLDRTIANARVELGWECDYEREAKACKHFRGLLKDDSQHFTVPEVYTHASGPGVLTAEYLKGATVTKIADLSQEERDRIGTQVLRLCLRELMEWRYMQTDPNWTNFLYNRQTQKLELLDFGASRSYPDEFIEPYVSLLIAASKGDRERCVELSIQLGYLTGRESPAMLQAHVDSIMTLAEPFVLSAPETYDFKDQTITERVRSNIGLMLRERLAPPPEETYSLHRKLSGAFLLCARLQSRVRARALFANAIRVWEQRAGKVDSP